MRAPAFDIYQSDAGYVPVTNDVRRAILAALAEEDLELPDLVEVTGKSKPTLSNLHMKELLSLGLIDERPHPTDARRKIYRLRARKIGSSHVPLDQLRGAVRHYVSLAPLAFAIPISSVVEILANPGPIPDKETVRAQGAKLGELSGHLFTASGAKDLLTGVASFWEREGIARGVSVQLDRLELEIEIHDRYCATKAGQDAVAAVLAGFLAGVARGRLGGAPEVAMKPLAPARRYRFGLEAA